jgi:hypothetical protein
MNKRRSPENSASLGQCKDRGLVPVSKPHRDQSFRVRIGTLQAAKVCAGKNLCIRVYKADHELR